MVSGVKFMGPSNMESHRDQKRQSAKKHTDFAVYTKKAVRAKEALLEKKLSCPAKPGKK